VLGPPCEARVVDGGKDPEIASVSVTETKSSNDQRFSDNELGPPRVRQISADVKTNDKSVIYIRLWFSTSLACLPRSSQQLQKMHSIGSSCVTCTTRNNQNSSHPQSDAVARKSAPAMFLGVTTVDGPIYVQTAGTTLVDDPSSPPIDENTVFALFSQTKLITTVCPSCALCSVPGRLKFKPDRCSATYRAR
jgi:hypothetical protein